MKLHIDKKDRYGGAGVNKLSHDPTWILKTKLLLAESYDVKFYYPIENKAHMFA